MRYGHLCKRKKLKRKFKGHEDFFQFSVASIYKHLKLPMVATMGSFVSEFFKTRGRIQGFSSF